LGAWPARRELPFHFSPWRKETSGADRGFDPNKL